MLLYSVVTGNPTNRVLKAKDALEVSGIIKRVRSRLRCKAQLYELDDRIDFINVHNRKKSNPLYNGFDDPDRGFILEIFIRMVAYARTDRKDRGSLFAFSVPFEQKNETTLLVTCFSSREGLENHFGSN